MSVFVKAADRGIFLKNPVENHITSPRFGAKPPGPTVALTRIQKLIAERMLQSKQTKPCFYLRLKADITDLMAVRHQLKKTWGIRVTTNAFFVRALALAAYKYPLMVGSLDGQNIKIADSINVGFAVNAPQGLVVPVIKNADQKGLAETAQLEQMLTDKARDNLLTLKDIEGQTIALSNLGAYGVDYFVGIVPLDTSTIVAVGNALSEAVPLNGQPMKRKMAYLSLAADYRFITGTYAAQFLNFIKEQLQNAQQLIN